MKGGEIWIEKDLTWERRVKWILKQVARMELGKGRKVRIGEGRIQIEGVWSFWDEEEEKLRDGNRK